MAMAGAKAAAMGSVVGTSLPSVFTLIVGIGVIGDSPSADAGWAVLLIFLPFLTGFFCSAVGLALVAVPMMLWLRGQGEESRRAYLSGGLIAGTLVSTAVCWWLFDGFFMAVLVVAAFGALTGGATGHFWWRYARREEVEGMTAGWAEVFE